MPGEECQEIKSPEAETYFGWHPEETHDDVREAHDMHQEEGEEISFVPSAISVPQKSVASL